VHWHRLCVGAAECTGGETQLAPARECSPRGRDVLKLSEEGQGVGWLSTLDDKSVAPEPPHVSCDCVRSACVLEEEFEIDDGFCSNAEYGIAPSPEDWCDFGSDCRECQRALWRVFSESLEVVVECI
jgi:hypothetical protein